MCFYASKLQPSDSMIEILIIFPSCRFMCRSWILGSGTVQILEVAQYPASGQYQAMNIMILVLQTPPSLHRRGSNQETLWFDGIRAHLSADANRDHLGLAPLPEGMHNRSRLIKLCFIHALVGCQKVHPNFVSSSNLVVSNKLPEVMALNLIDNLEVATEFPL
jgi:hypothetical protein